MKVTTAPADNREIRVTLELDAPRVDTALKTVAAALAPKVNIPGFRKAKVPYRVLERYLGRPAMLAEAHPRLRQEAIQQYLKDNRIEDAEKLILEREQDDPVAYTFRVVLEPYVALGDFADLRVETRDLAWNEETQAEARDKILAEFTTLEAKNDAAAWGDAVTLQIKSVILDETRQPTDEIVLDEDAWEVELDPQFPLDPPGLDQEIVGQAPGARKEFVLTYPADGDSVHAGKAARFELAVTSVQSYQQPTWDAQLLARALGEEEAAHPVEEYEQRLWQRAYELEARRIFDQELEDAFAALESVSVLEISNVTVENQIDALIEQRMRDLQQFGIRNLETYLRFAQQTLEQYRAALRPAALKIIKQNLMLWEFAACQGLAVPEAQQAELDAQARQLARELMQDSRFQGKASEDGLHASLMQQGLSDALGRLGRNALLELVTNGAHSLEDVRLPAAAPAQEAEEAAAAPA